MSILFVFSLVLMEWNAFWLLPECILKAEILCSMEWFEKKLMDVSVVAGLWNMSISRLDGFRIISRSRKLMHRLFLYVGLSFMFVCIWFLCVLMRSGCVILVSYIIKTLSA